MSIAGAQTYLLPQTHSVWEWDLEDRTVHWLTGTTIAFPQELVAVLERFTLRGFPRFDCLLLVLAALRDSWPPFNTNSEYDKLRLDCFKDAGLTDHQALELILQLDRLNRLPSELRLAVGIKPVLCDMVLEDSARRCVGEDMELVLSGLRSRREDIPSQEILSIPSEHTDQWRLDLLALKAGLERFDEQRLRSRIATGIDEPLIPAKELAEGEWFSDAVEARELVETLLQDKETYSLGRLAKDLLAALYRPARLVPEKSLQMEGYSDITNRGTLDRLLLTELAHDNDTLAVRVANGEALYMRREVPPTSEAVDRCILIDCGIRSWGTPRVYSAAIALALTATAPNESHVHAWRTTADGPVRSFFVDQSGMIEHLGALNTKLHPGDELEPFYDEVVSNPTRHEVYVILSRDAWNDPGFRSALLASKLNHLTAAVIDRFGVLELIAYSRSGLQSLKSIVLILDEKPRESMPQSSAWLASEELPCIFQCNPFPLRLSHANSTYYPVDKGLLLSRVNSDKLALWDDAGQGGVTLQTKLPKGRIAWAGRDSERRSLLVVWQNGSSALHTVMRFDLTDYALLEMSSIHFDSDDLQFSTEQNSLIVSNIQRQQIQAWDIATATVISHVQASTEMNGPVFRTGTGWVAARFNGLGFDVLPVAFKQEPRQSNLPFVMVSPLRDGYLAITSEGRILHSNGWETRIPWAHAENLVSGRTSVLGDSRWVRFDTRLGSFVVELSDGGTPVECRPYQETSDLHQGLVWGSGPKSPRISNRSYRNRFHRIGVIDGELALMRGQRVMTLKYVNSSLCWVDRYLGSNVAFQSAIPFVDKNDITKEVGYRLQFADKDSFQAVLDVRGLLHLRSLNSIQTELTLTISDGLASGWTSDGRWFGSAYHCGSNAFTSAHEIANHVLRPLLERYSGGSLCSI